MDSDRSFAPPVFSGAEAVPIVASVSEQAESGHPLRLFDAIRIALVAIAAAAVWFHVPDAFDHVSVIGVLIGGWPIFKEAAENIAERRMTMELSMSIAIVAAAAITEFFTALVITLFVLVAEVLEHMTISRGRRAIRDLLELLPRSVTVRGRNGCESRPSMNCASGSQSW
jgi:cation transport ATPase